MKFSIKDFFIFCAVYVGLQSKFIDRFRNDRNIDR